MSRVAHPAGPLHASVLPADHPPAPPADLNALHPGIWPRSATRKDGVLTIGGVVSMVLGSFMLYEAPEAGFRVSWTVILPTVGASAGLVVWAVSAGVRAMMRPPTTGAAGMIGQHAVVRAALDPEGQVQLDGELWRAVAEDAPVPAGETVRVTGVDGLTLRVSRAANRS